MWDFINKILGKKVPQVVETTPVPPPAPAPVPPKPVPQEPKKMKPSANCIAIVETSEGCRLKPYLDTGKVATIGFGSTFYEDGTKVTMADPAITKERAETLLVLVLGNFCDEILKMVKVPLTQNQLDALSCFVYNIGTGQFGGSTMLKLLNNKDYAGAAAQFPRWNKDNGVVLNGLIKRRAAEQKLFES